MKTEEFLKTLKGVDYKQLGSIELHFGDGGRYIGSPVAKELGDGWCHYYRNAVFFGDTEDGFCVSPEIVKQVDVVPVEDSYGGYYVLRIYTT